MAEKHEPLTPPPGPTDDEVLDTGQEEVFSRTEVELGETEHPFDAGGKRPTPSDRRD